MLKNFQLIFLHIKFLLLKEIKSFIILREFI